IPLHHPHGRLMRCAARYAVAVLCLLSALSAPSAAADLNIKVGDVVTNPLVIGGGAPVAQIPLPDGEGSGLGVRPRQADTTGRAKMGLGPEVLDIGLTQDRGNQRQMLLQFSVLTAPSLVEGWVDEPCKPRALLHRNNYGTSAGNIKCLTIEHQTTTI